MINLYNYMRRYIKFKKIGMSQKSLFIVIMIFNWSIQVKSKSNMVIDCTYNSHHHLFASTTMLFFPYINCIFGMQLQRSIHWILWYYNGRQIFFKNFNATYLRIKLRTLLKLEDIFCALLRLKQTWYSWTVIY
jgi:hypothetical protein